MEVLARIKGNRQVTRELVSDPQVWDEVRTLALNLGGWFLPAVAPTQETVRK